MSQQQGVAIAHAPRATGGGAARHGALELLEGEARAPVRRLELGVGALLVGERGAQLRDLAHHGGVRRLVHDLAQRGFEERRALGGRGRGLACAIRVLREVVGACQGRTVEARVEVAHVAQDGERLGVGGDPEGLGAHEKEDEDTQQRARDERGEEERGDAAVGHGAAGNRVVSLVASDMGIVRIRTPRFCEVRHFPILHL